MINYVHTGLQLVRVQVAPRISALGDCELEQRGGARELHGTHHRRAALERVSLQQGW